MAKKDPVSVISVHDVDIDFSAAVVEAIKSYQFDLELRVSGVKVAGSEINSLLFRFEGIKDFPETWHKLTTKSRLAKDKKKNDYWPLALPSRLTRLVRRGRVSGHRRRYELELDDPHFQDQPFEIVCKRLCVTKLSGKPLADDANSISDAKKKKWKKKDFREFGFAIADAVENDRYKRVHRMFSPILSKQKSLKRLRKDLDKWKSQGITQEKLQKSFRGKLHDILICSETDLPDLVPRCIELDECVTALTIIFFGRFAWFLTIVSYDGELRIGHYKFHSNWEEY